MTNQPPKPREVKLLELARAFQLQHEPVVSRLAIGYDEVFLRGQAAADSLPTEREMRLVRLLEQAAGQLRGMTLLLYPIDYDEQGPPALVLEILNVLEMHKKEIGE